MISDEEVRGKIQELKVDNKIQSNYYLIKVRIKGRMEKRNLKKKIDAEEEYEMRKEFAQKLGRVGIKNGNDKKSRER